VFGVTEEKLLRNLPGEDTVGGLVAAAIVDGYRDAAARPGKRSGEAEPRAGEAYAELGALLKTSGKLFYRLAEATATEPKEMIGPVFTDFVRPETGGLAETVAAAPRQLLLILDTFYDGFTEAATELGDQSTAGYVSGMLKSIGLRPSDLKH
jgi:hypothetical protein